MRSLVRRTISLSAISSLLMHPGVRPYLRRVPCLGAVYRDGWIFRHPMDRFYRIDTSGNAPPPAIDGEPVFYAASQPSIIRAALRALPPLEGFTFIDLGCGKGRALIVATEFPFRAICGIEYSDELAAVARRNAARIERRYPARTK